LVERTRDLAGGILDLSHSDLARLPPEVLMLLASLSREEEDGRKITSVLLARNKFSVVPAEFSALKLLRELDISDNKLGVTDPETLQHMQMPALRILNVSRNGMTFLHLEAIVEALAESRTLLSVLLAEGNQLDRFPRNIHKVYAVRELSLAGNRIRKIDVALGGLEKLEVSGQIFSLH